MVGGCAKFATEHLTVVAPELKDISHPKDPMVGGGVVRRRSFGLGVVGRWHCRGFPAKLKEGTLHRRGA